MENLILLRIEIVLLFLSLGYFIFYVGEKILFMYLNIKRIVKPDKKIAKQTEDKINKLIKNKESQSEIEEDKKTIREKLNRGDIDKINEILKRVQINSVKGYTDTAKSLIVEGLAIDKYNRDLNIELANIYENEKNYKKAEYIYVDLLNAYKNNFKILKKLGFNLALQRKFDDSIKIFLLAYNKRKDDNDVLEILADLTYEMKYYKKSLKFIKLFLKQAPRNTEKLKMKGFCLELLGKTEEAIEAYKKVLDLQPYNSKVVDRLRHLEG